MEYRISKQSGTAFTIGRDKTFSVTTPEGRQVADLVAFVQSDTTPLSERS